MHSPIQLIAISAATVLFCGISFSAETPANWDSAVADAAASHLARPSKAQYDWQEMERAMFIQLDPATHQGGEYDNRSTPMKDIKFEKLDVNEWCEAAKGWGAKEIVFMLQHSGGFCMWPSKTTEYHIGNTPYKDGKGDVVREFAEACRKHGLKAGFYMWPPRSQEQQQYVYFDSRDIPVKDARESSAVAVARFRELHERLGGDLVTEIWIDLMPRFLSVGREVNELFPNAVLMAPGCNDPFPTIRWPGTESGTVNDPCWSTTRKATLTHTKPTTAQQDGDAQTQAGDDPDGDYWAPHEADTPLHHHFWHMRAGALENRKSVANLMDVYEKSAGRNSFIILNCAPQVDGSIHPDDMKRYKEFGDEINRRYGHPLAVVEQVSGNEVELNLAGMKTIDCADLWEDYRYGQRIREYVVEGFDGQVWIPLAKGTSVGRRKLDFFATETISKVRVRVTKSVGTPLIRKLQVHFTGMSRSITARSISASSEHETKQFPPAYAVDGHANTYWVSDDKTDKTPTLTLDLGVPRKIAHASLAEAFEPRIKKFRIEGRLKADDPWTTLYTGGDVKGRWEGDIDQATVRFVRLVAEEFSNVNIGIREFAVLTAHR